MSFLEWMFLIIALMFVVGLFADAMVSLLGGLERKDDDKHS